MNPADPQLPEAPQASRDTDPSLQGEKRQCLGTSRKTGEQCKAFSVRGEQYCAGHLGLGGLDPHRAAERSAEVRQAAAQERRKTPRDVYAGALAANAEVFAARLVKIAKEGDDADALRAIEALNSRVLGKPKETVEQVAKPADLQAIEDMTDEELWAAWRAAEQA